MSATGRGAERVENDYYPTPAWCVHRLLEATDFLVPGRGRRWLEPAVGRGHAIEMAVNEWQIDRLDSIPLWSTCDIDPEAGAQITADYLTAGRIDGFMPTVFDVGITNPPYSLAEAFAKTMRSHCRISALLLRLNFLEGAKRSGWLRSDPPDVYILPNRPSFSGNGKTDATAYAWMVWGQGGGRIRILADTPKSERCSRSPNIAP